MRAHLLLDQIDGTFRLHKPPVLLGYTQDARNVNEELGLGASDHTYITVFITFEPGLTEAEPSKEKVGDIMRQHNMVGVFYTFRTRFQCQNQRTAFLCSIFMLIHDVRAASNCGVCCRSV